MEDSTLRKTEFTEEQLAKLKALHEYENPKPRNRAERRLQEKRNRNKLTLL